MASQYQLRSNSNSFTWKNDSKAGEIPAYVYHGAKDDEVHPIAIQYHAGGFVMGSTSLIAKAQVDYLVSKGFVVVQPEYRLAPQVTLREGPIADARESFLWVQEKLPALLKENLGILVDVNRIVSIGYSAGGLLALATGSLPNPPRAIVDFYGAKYLDDDSYKQPFAGFAGIPSLPEDFTNKIYDGPTAFTSIPMFVDGKPALHDPRAAWFISQLKNGTSISSIVPDGNHDFDIERRFEHKFPPTFFVHGSNDPFIPAKLSIKANDALKKAGNESEILLGDDIAHMFDLELTETDPQFTTYVVPAMDFAIKHV